METQNTPTTTYGEKPPVEYTTLPPSQLPKMTTQSDIALPESGEEQQPGKLSDSNSDGVISSSDEIENDNAEADEDQVNDVLGVSISQVQSRMKARQTPAEEKTRAIERSGGYFDVIPDEISGAQDQVQLFEEPESIEEPAATQGGIERRKLEKNAPKSNRHSFTRSMLMSSLSGRRRALSGDSGYGINLRRLLTDFSLTPSRQSSSSTKFSSTDSTLRSRSSSTPHGRRDDSENTSTHIASKSSSTIHSTNDDGLTALGALRNTRTHSYQQYPITKKRPPSPTTVVARTHTSTCRQA